MNIIRNTITLGMVLITVFFSIEVQQTTNTVNENSHNNQNIIKEELEVEEPIVFNGLTEEELTKQINRTLSSTLSNQGNLFVKHSLKHEIDPYLAVAIALHETGCMWECSSLVKQCNNVGGQKGQNNICGSYQYFDSLESGIEGLVTNLSSNYYKYGLNTPELINTKYATSTAWSEKIHYYINLIKNN